MEENHLGFMGWSTFQLSPFEAKSETSFTFQNLALYKYTQIFSLKGQLW